MTNYGDTLSSEEKLEQVWRFMNQLRAAGMDRLVESGYLQWDGIKIRLDDHGIQVESAGNQETSIYFVNKLVPDPSAETTVAEVLGDVDGSTSLIGQQATYGGANLAAVLIGAGAATANAELTIYISPDTNQPRAKLSPLAADLGQFDLQYTVLKVALASDPGTPANGMIWYNTTTNQLKARVNGATVVIA